MNRFNFGSIVLLIICVSCASHNAMHEDMKLMEQSQNQIELLENEIARLKDSITVYPENRSIYESRIIEKESHIETQERLYLIHKTSAERHNEDAQNISRGAPDPVTGEINPTFLD